MAAIKRVAILTSGGDAPGMNAAIRAVTLISHAAGVEVFGVERGYRGLLDNAMAPLGPADVAGILREGGTILGSARCREFHQREVRDRARSALRQLGIEGLIVIGGNGSLTGALRLTDLEELGEQPLSVIGIPASIDNDLGYTGMCIGVDTAMNTIVEACDKIADTATAHDRTFLIEVMGRDCGYLAMTSAIAAGADLSLFPEAGRSEEAIVDSVVDAVLAARRRTRRGRRVLVIKAEGVAIPIDRLKTMVDVRLREREPGADPAAIETRVTVLGHVVRGGRPSAFDRLLGSRLANAGIRALLSGETRKMAAWTPPVEMAPDVAVRSPVDPYCWLVDLEAALEETERLLHGSSALARWRAAAFDDIDEAMAL
jgi:6-phosphofructokinase 1